MTEFNPDDTWEQMEDVTDQILKDANDYGLRPAVCRECHGDGCIYCQPTLTFDAGELCALVPELNAGGLAGTDLDYHVLKALGPFLPTEWTQKNGHAIQLQAMSDKHLFNTVRLLIRRAARTRAEEVGRLCGYAGSETWGPRGDGACTAVEEACGELMGEVWSDRALPHLWAFLAEARRRGTIKGLDAKAVAEYGKGADRGQLKTELAAMKRVSDADKLIRAREALA